MRSEYEYEIPLDDARSLLNELCPQPQIEKNIGLIYIKQSNLVQAKEHLERAVALNPSLHDAHFFLAEIYLKTKDIANAKKSFQQVITLAPQSPFGQKAREYLQSLR